MAQSRVGSVDGRCSPSEHNVGKTLWGRRFHRQAGKVPLPTDSLSKARSETAGTVAQLNSGIQVCAPYLPRICDARCAKPMSSWRYPFLSAPRLLAAVATTQSRLAEPL